MADNNEVITLVMSVIMLLLFICYRSDMVRLPSGGWFVAAYLVAILGWVATVVEGFIFPAFLNVLEHAADLAAAVLLSIWIWRLFKPDSEKAA